MERATTEVQMSDLFPQEKTPGLKAITLAAGRIMDVFCGGDTSWRDRLDPTEFDNFYASADWLRAVELATAALAIPKEGHEQGVRGAEERAGGEDA